MKTNVYFSSNLAQYFLEWEMPQTKFVDKITTHILCWITLFENLAINEIMWKNTVERGRPQMTMAHAHCALDNVIPSHILDLFTLSYCIYIYIYSSSSSCIGNTAHPGLWPVEQYPSIFPYLSPSLNLSRFSLCWTFLTVSFLLCGVVSPTPNPQPWEPGYPFLFGSSPLTCLAWVALPVAYTTASIALGIMWSHKPHH